MNDDELPFPRRINRDRVGKLDPHPPARSVLTGSMVTLERLDPERHAAQLYRVGHGSEAALRSWEYLPWGPFADEQALAEQLGKFAVAPDLFFYAICDAATGESVGKATYLDIAPANGVIEIGGIWFAPEFQRTRGATEALFLMLSYAMDELGYRRMQWRCNAQNAKSRAAARRLGFRFEGIWFNHMIVKGVNRDTAWYSILDSEWPTIRTAVEAWLDPGNFDSTGSQRKSLSEMTLADRRVRPDAHI